MVFHAPSIHFHLGAWAVSILCVILAVTLEVGRNLFRSRIKKEYQEMIIYNVDRLDFAAHISGIIGLLGLIVSGFAGIIDASGHKLESLELDALLETFSLETFMTGMEVSSMSEDIAFKIIWTIVGAYFFVFLGAIRIYYVNLRHERMYDQRTSVLLLYVFSAVTGFFTMVVVAGAGGAMLYGSSLLNLTPLTAGFLPGEPMMPLLIMVETGISLLIMVWIWIRPSTPASSKVISPT